ncbi:inositol 2-dehydrogenase [Cyclobacteriaceae bacterium]|jgi:myo-inositol 2-dehydrogenase/D-chiro-inositol 1-dehydrogenase|nr:inositol 2-dehydrogenase [Cyclobacteriaceae bacterium]
MNKVKIGVVGLGRLGHQHADNIVNNVRNAQLSAVCSVQEDELDRAKKEWGLDQCYTDYNEMLAQAELDAVAIISPSNLHCEQVISALEKELHVFCEKPLGISKAECWVVEKAVAAQPKSVFMLGFMRRYDPSYAYAKKKIESGYIGRPILFRGYSVDPESAIDGAIKYAANSAGQFLDMAIHDIDLARWFLQSEPKSIYAMGGCYAHQEFAKYEDGDNVSALMQFENESMAFLLAGRTAPHGYNVETEIIGTLGQIRIGSVPQKNLVELMDATGVRKECAYSFSERFHEAFVNEMQEFVDCIIEDRKPSVSAHDGTRSTIIAELATQSFKNNELIKID